MPVAMLVIVVRVMFPLMADPLALTERRLQVGLVTQAVESPFLDGKTLGLAKLRQDVRVPGTSLTARVGDDDVAATVVEHPVYEKERRRAKEAP